MKSKAILICGKIGSGKSYYAESLKLRENAVILSCDELMLTLFGTDAGEMHDEYSRRTQQYLFNKSLDILNADVTVILDWGFWLKQWRSDARSFYESRGIPCELHYIKVSDEVQQLNLKQRNAEIAVGKSDAYYVDEGLAAKASSLFEEPSDDEIDLYYENTRS